MSPNELPSPLTPLLCRWLDEAEATETPYIECHVIFRDQQMSSGRVSRGPLVGTYIIRQQATVPTEHGPRKVEGKAVEIFFTEFDIQRLARVVDLETSGIVTAGGRKIFTP